MRHDDRKCMTGEAEVRRRPRSRRLLIAGLALLMLAIGLVAGFVLRPLIEPPAAAPAPPAVSPSSPVPPPPPASAACRRVAQDGGDLLVQLERAVAAIAALDPAALRQVVDAVERLQDDLQREVDACDTGSGPDGEPRSELPLTPGPSR
jgi:hypothetical protein